jgi:hypothetical protein
MFPIFQLRKAPIFPNFRILKICENFQFLVKFSEILIFKNFQFCDFKSLVNIYKYPSIYSKL